MQFNLIQQEIDVIVLSLQLTQAHSSSALQSITSQINSARIAQAQSQAQADQSQQQSSPQQDIMSVKPAEA